MNQLQQLIKDWTYINKNLEEIFASEVDLVFGEAMKEIARTQIVDTKLAFDLLRQITRDVFGIQIMDSDFPSTDIWLNSRKQNRVAGYNVTYKNGGLKVTIDISNHEIYQQELGGTNGNDYPSQSDEALILGRPKEWKAFHVTTAMDKADTGNLKGFEIALKLMIENIVKIFETEGVR